MKRAQRRTRQHNERIEALKCIDDLEALVNSIDLTVYDVAHQARLRIVAFRKEMQP